MAEGCGERFCCEMCQKTQPVLLKSPDHDLLCLHCENRSYKVLVEELINPKSNKKSKTSDVKMSPHNYYGDKRYYPGKL